MENDKGIALKTEQLGLLQQEEGLENVNEIMRFKRS